MQTRVATRRDWGRLTGGASMRKLAVVHEQIEPAAGGVEADAIAVTHERDWAARRSFGRYVQNHRAVGRAAHARV